VLECELCITVDRRLAGPGVTRADVEAAVSSIAPAMEVANLGRVPGVDLGQLMADNVSQWGYLIGPVTTPYPKGLELGDVEIVATINGQITQKGLAREVIDNQLDSLAWLANNLGAYGLALEPGHKVITGSCLNPAVVAKGQRWEATFTGLGSVVSEFQ
jgi:2-keto-4-pentenoate hydratase